MRAKPATQQRSQDKQERILTAMDALLRKHAFPEIGIAELAREAEVSPATIYQRFSNVDAVASVLMELYFRKVEEWARRPRKRKIASDASLAEALKAIAVDALDQLDALGHIMRPAYLYSRQHPDRVGKEWSRLQEVALQGFRSFLQSRAGQVRVKNVDEAAQVLCHLFNLQLLGPLLHGDEPYWRSAANRKRFAETLGTLAYRYLAFPGRGAAAA